MHANEDPAVNRRAEYLSSLTLLPNGTIGTQAENILTRLAEANPELYTLALENRVAARLFMELVGICSNYDRATADEEIAALQTEYPQFVFVLGNDPNLSALEDAALAKGDLTDADKVNFRRAVVKQMDERNQ